jgi:hypothetical protein
MMEEQLIHAQHFVIIYTKATSVNSWLDNSCVVVAKDDLSCHVILNHIESTLQYFWNFILKSTTVESKLL